MKFRNSLFTIMFLFLMLNLASEFKHERKVVRINKPTTEIMKTLLEKNFDIASYSPGNYLDLVVCVQKKNDLLRMGHIFEVTQTESDLINNLRSRDRNVYGYRTYDEVVDELFSFEEDYPDLAKVYNLGESWGNIYYNQGIDYYEDYQFEIWGLKVTLNPEEEQDKPGVYYIGALHAREPLSVEVPMEFINQLLTGYEDDPQIEFLIDNTEIWFVPLINPDGHRVVLDEIDVWWRKNIRDNNGNQEFDTFNYYGMGIDGVDLNRNFGYYWQHDSSVQAPTYPGPEPFSEPEAAAVQQLISNRHFVAGISYHTYGEMVLYPYGYSENVHAPDVDVLGNLAQELAEATPKIASAGHYDPMPAWDLYPARGTSEDYFYGVHGIIAFTFEMANQFIPPYTTAQQIVQDNMEACMILLNRVHYSKLTGIVTNSVSGEVLEAEVFVHGIDNSGEYRHPIKSREPFGRYYRLLEPGLYDVTFSAHAYNNITFSNVEISDTGVTILNVEMTEVDRHSISGYVVDNISKEPIENASVKILNSDIPDVITGPDGYYIFHDLIPDHYELSAHAENYSLIVSDFDLVDDLVENFYLYSYCYSEDFDHGLDNWVLTGSWGLCQEHSFSGSYSLADSPGGNYENNVSSQAILQKLFDLTDTDNCSIEFHTKYLLESEQDFVFFDVHHNHQWHTIDSFTGSEGEWHKKIYNLNQFLGDHIRFRFRFISNTSGNDLGFFVDSIKMYIEGKESTSQIDIPPVLVSLHNFPNPFTINDTRNSGTVIEFALSHPERVKLAIYNIKGQKINTLINEHLNAGIYSISWNGNNYENKTVSSGVYLFRLSTSTEDLFNKMLLLR